MTRNALFASIALGAAAVACSDSYSTQPAAVSADAESPTPAPSTPSPPPSSSSQGAPPAQGNTSTGADAGMDAATDATDPSKPQCAPTPASAAAGPYSVPDLQTDWLLPTPVASADGTTGYYAIDSRLTVVTDPGPNVNVWLSTIVWFAAAPTDQGSALLALEQEGNGKWAMVFLNGATASTPADGGGCDAGSGGRCWVPYAWVEGHQYLLQMAFVSQDTWQASAKDETTGISTVIGTMTAPAGWQRLAHYVASWTSNNAPTGGYPDCTAAPKVTVQYYAPTIDGATTQASFDASLIGTGGTCANVQACAVPSKGVATHSMNQ
jgi:hypothetical protein